MPLHVGVQSFQAIAKAHLLCLVEAQSGIADFQAGLSGTDSHALPARNGAAIHQTLFQQDGRRDGIGLNPTRINDGDTFLRGKP